MIKQNGYIENHISFSKLTQSNLVSIQIHWQSELDWGSFWKTNRFPR